MQNQDKPTAQTLTLAGLHECLEGVLALSRRGRDLLAHLELAQSTRRDYSKYGFARLENIVEPEALTTLILNLLPILTQIAQEITLLHHETSAKTLSDGHHFWRVALQDISDSAVRDKMLLLFESLGLEEFGRSLASTLTPLVQYIAGPICYHRFSFHLYNEGDYISIHNDAHMGERVNVQFPVTFGASGGIRILSNGLFTMYYDVAGSMNVLGPRVWHDVPPLLRVDPAIAPQRVTLSLGFVPCHNDGS